MLPRIGKIDGSTFDRIIYPRLGKPDRAVLIGPRHGVDAAVIELPGGGVMVTAEDPTFGMPVLMPHFGWAIVHICASDVAVLGVKPRYLSICLMLPPESEESVLEGIWKQVHEECEKLEISIVGGHTGVYPGIAYPLNGGCSVFGFGRREQLTPACNARVGDRLIMTKGPAIQAAGMLALQAEKALKLKLGGEIVEKAKKLFFEMTVVKDALIAAPSAHAMHDTTEGGLLNGVYEMAAASGTGVALFENRIITPPEVSSVCEYFKIDPLISIGEGTLLISAAPEKTAQLLSDLGGEGIRAWEIGEITDGEKIFFRKDGSREQLKPVTVDPFWGAYFSALEE